jgi:hypothetical protein
MATEFQVDQKIDMLDPPVALYSAGILGAVAICRERKEP